MQLCEVDGREHCPDQRFQRFLAWNLMLVCVCVLNILNKESDTGIYEDVGYFHNSINDETILICNIRWFLRRIMGYKEFLFEVSL